MCDWTAETAEWYAEHYGEYATNRLAVDALHIPTDATIIDVGCGTGSALRRVASRAPDATLVGIDPVPRMLEIARERAARHPEGSRISFREGFAEELPVADGEADVIFAFDSFDHWRNQAEGLSEIRRALRRTGRLIVVKDASVPGSDDAEANVVSKLRETGFDVLARETLAEDDVACTMWVCGLSGDATGGQDAAS